ncbi:NUDIX domain-containing protein [Bacillus carboniphilus]|uniref:NUDIX domain-containing protein n=1 Tax=Bacillus carboniphilus TaxID=86663 RepID=A0ABN0VXS7_9BACI
MFIVNVEAAIHKDGRWLIIQRGLKEEHEPGTLSLVGGKVDQEGNVADVLEHTVKREVEEELGIILKDNVRYVHGVSFVAGDSVHVINIVFLGEIASGEPYRKSPDEVENIYWMTSEEILNHQKTPPWLKDSITKADKLLLTKKQ